MNIQDSVRVCVHVNHQMIKNDENRDKAHNRDSEVRVSAVSVREQRRRQDSYGANARGACRQKLYKTLVNRQACKQNTPHKHTQTHRRVLETKALSLQ